MASEGRTSVGWKDEGKASWEKAGDSTARIMGTHCDKQDGVRATMNRGHSQSRGGVGTALNRDHARGTSEPLALRQSLVRPRFFLIFFPKGNYDGFFKNLVL